MADLFLSYKSEDRARVAPLVKALQADGLSVWWDAAIEGGTGWRQAIERELGCAKCVLVVWSKRSAGPEGEFVHDEASRAKRRGVYLPVRIDAVEPPIGFGETQALSLVGWKQGRSDARYQAVLAAARALVAGPAPAVGAGAPATPAPAIAAPGIGRRSVIGGAALGGAALAGGGWWLLRPKIAQAAASIAVLPFANLSGDPAQAYFSDGIAEELRSSLSRIAGLQVAARTSSEKMRDADVKEAAATLGVANVLTGSVRKGCGTIRVSTQLLNGETGLETWSEVYDRPEGDALVVQTSIATSVANALSLSLGKAAAMLGGTKNPAAYDAYLRGAAFWAEQRFDDALPAYALAVAIDPNFALARTGLAIMMVSAAYAGSTDPGPAVAAAEMEARRAVALAPRLGAPLAALGFILMARLDLRGAAAAHAAAYRLAPGDPYVVRNYAKFQAMIGRGDDAMRAAYRYVALDPLSPNSAGALAAVLYRSGRLDDAIAAYRRALAGLPGDIEALAELSLALLATGQTRAALTLTGSMPPGSWQELTVRAIALARLGDRAGSDRALDQLRSFGTGFFYQIAEVLAQRGEIDAAFAALDRAYALMDAGLSDLKTDLMMQPLHGDPRYAALIRQIGFP